VKFQRNVRFARGHLDPTPFASVFFCTLIFVLLASMVYVPGVHIQLPASSAPLPGAEGPTIAVALSANGTLYFKNRDIQPPELLERLKSEVARHTEPLTLVVFADKSVTFEQFDELRDLAAGAGVKQIVQAVQPRLFDTPPQPKQP
jgi:biopolymer transport protein ExbD